MNSELCRCSYCGDSKRTYCYSVREIGNYRQNIGGPLLSRIDLHVDVPLVDFRELPSTAASGDSSATIRDRVKAAREIQLARFRKKPTKTQCGDGIPASERTLQARCGEFELSLSCHGAPRLLGPGS